MATVLPSEFPRDHSSAEHLVYRKLRDETQKDWIALHSVGLASHERKLWAEVDFVVVTDYAVLCLEVKGGDLHIRGNSWFAGDRRLTHTPMEQAGGAASALRTFLRQEFREETPTVGWGVLFPRARYDALDPAVARELVFDDDDVARPMQSYVDGLNDYWRRRKENGTGAQFGPDLRERIVAALAPHFDLVSTLRSRIRGITHDLIRLTTAQREILDGFMSEPRLVVRGGAGTGKTVLAASEAERLAGEGAEVLVTCASTALAADFRRALDAHVSVTAMGAPALASRDIAHAGVGTELPHASTHETMHRFLPEIAARTTRDAGPRYDALILDEGQELVGPFWLDYFDSLLRGGLEGAMWRVFLDPNQDLLLGGNPDAIDRLDALATSRYRLRKNCRNTREIGTATAMLTGLDTQDTLHVEGLDVVEHFYTSQDHERTLAVSVVREWLDQGVGESDIVLLSHLPMQQSGVAGVGEHELGVPIVETADPTESIGRGIRFCSVDTYKGFESDAVLITDVDDLGAGPARLALYVGMTRARALLGLLLGASTRAAYSELVADFARRARP